jgi:hypothetical protein
MDDEGTVFTALEEHSRLKRADQRAIEALLDDRERLMVQALLRRHRSTDKKIRFRWAKHGTTIIQDLMVSPRLSKHLSNLMDENGAVISPRLTQRSKKVLEDYVEQAKKNSEEGAARIFGKLYNSASAWWREILS